MSEPGIFFELGVADADRARDFYTGVFGWRMEPAPSGRGFVVDAGGVPGGLHPDDPQATPCVFFRVDDLDAAIERVRARGGEVLEVDAGDEDPESVARFGRFKLCRDDQGSPFGLRELPRGAGA